MGHGWSPLLPILRREWAFAYGISVATAGANLFALLLIRRFRSYQQLQVIVLTFTSTAVFASLWLAAAAEWFLEYGGAFR